ncbi:MAG: sugar ABC transporter permease [Candidatus Nanopelagicaceae bacterium]|jgi:arabinogalactan oligomer/maltooligosaccharide transport system permease protein
MSKAFSGVTSNNSGGQGLTVRTNKKSFGQWFKEVGWKHIIAWVMIIYAVFPILYIISTSLTDFGGIENAALFQQFHYQNYLDLFNDPSYPFARWMMNTIIIAGATAILSVFISACAAYAFSRLRFKGRRPGLLALILIQMFPSISGLVAIFGILSWLTDNVPAIGLGTKAGLILVYLGGSLGAGTYLMYGFFNTVPTEIDEAAKIDGATHTQIYFQIILRLVAPVLAVMALLSFIGTFSDYILASIVFSKTEQQTVAVGLGTLLNDPWSQKWAMFCAGAIIAATPIVALFMGLQRYIVSGLTGGAVKG